MAAPNGPDLPSGVYPLKVDGNSEVFAWYMPGTDPIRWESVSTEIAANPSSHFSEHVSSIIGRCSPGPQSHLFPKGLAATLGTGSRGPSAVSTERPGQVCSKAGNRAKMRVTTICY